MEGQYTYAEAAIALGLPNALYEGGSPKGTCHAIAPADWVRFTEADLTTAWKPSLAALQRETRASREAKTAPILPPVLACPRQCRLLSTRVALLPGR